MDLFFPLLLLGCLLHALQRKQGHIHLLLNFTDMWGESIITLMHVENVGKRDLAPFIRSCSLEYPCAGCISLVTELMCISFLF